jgi:hypothetical protein
MRRPWGNTREEFQAPYDLDKSKHREQERGTYYKRHQKQFVWD